MTKIDCAQNNELEKELTKFLQERNYSTKQENDLLIVNEKLPKSILDLFLQETNRARHKITLIEPDSFLLAIPVNMEEIGLETCEFCGYTSHHDLVSVHRRTHQAL
ncbi:hypothetical protein [Candidatus Nitrosopumilus sediminis]|uniref:Uncharacterized protein n=1 Tax=Candidatus Nitrosopumilus sediminis TaxID=1229909 RepID=K0BBU7_9ARCH|nr:hypothetical protein [Candidatus Nitrosopumilus sediminis]AFS82607.1 hypothetical protein NSED_04005 [Candidatus Nitrosopumilus sediminis]